MQNKIKFVLVLAGCLLTMPDCAGGSYGRVGTTVSHIDEYKGTQMDHVPLMRTRKSFVKSILLKRHKSKGAVTGYDIELVFSYFDSTNIRALILDGGQQKIVLSGTSYLMDVDANSSWVEYIYACVFPITELQIRELAEFNTVIVTVDNELDYSIELGNKALVAIDLFKETFLDQDGEGEWVTRESMQKTK